VSDGPRPRAPGGDRPRTARIAGSAQAATLRGMRIAVLSDIHANLPALEAVLAALGPVDAVWHLGDVVGYGPHPDEVVARLRELGAVGVRGNHDAAVGDLGMAEWFNADAQRAIAWTAGRISPETRAWLAGLPERAELGEMTLVHGSPRDATWEYIMTTPDARANLAAFATPYCLFGHTHVPAAWREVDGRVEPLGPTHGSVLPLDGRRLLLNPGSVGQPRDGDPRASAAILDTAASTLTWHRVAYPIATTRADIRAVGLPGWLADRLVDGR
jgi:predicted phosphodiesterase